MYGSFPFVLVSVLVALHAGAAQAVPLTELPRRLPAALLRALDQQGPGDFDAPKAAGIAGGAGLSETELPKNAFENAASRGLESLAGSGKAPSLEELMAVASAAAGVYSVSSAASDPGALLGPGADESSNEKGITVRDLAQVLVNRVELPIEQNPAPASARPAGAGGYSLFNAVMEAQLEADFIETAMEVVTPTITADGVVALDFLGLLDFAFIMSPVTNRIQVTDFTTGTTITLNQSADREASQPDRFGGSDVSQPSQRVRTAAPRLTVKQFLYRTRQFFSTYVLHPFTLGSLLLFAIFWVVLRIGRRSA